MDENPSHTPDHRNLAAHLGAMQLPGQIDEAHGARADPGGSQMMVVHGYAQENQPEGVEPPLHEGVEGVEEMEGMEGDAAMDVGSVGIVAAGVGNQLTLSFQGEVYVFDFVTPEKVQAVLLLLGGRELITGVGSPPQSLYQNNRRSNIPQRMASLMRFREKRKERNFGKNIRYDVRKEVAQRMQRHRGQFAPSNPKTDAAKDGVTNLNTTQHWGSVEGLPLVQSASECHHCRISVKSTPMMRRGPDGPRTLCNACGLMWASKGTLRDLSRGSAPPASTNKGFTTNEPSMTNNGGEVGITDQPLVAHNTVQLNVYDRS